MEVLDEIYKLLFFLLKVCVLLALFISMGLVFLDIYDIWISKKARRLRRAKK